MTLEFGRVLPMLAASARPFDDDAFVWEAKLDGIRCLAFVGADGRVRLQNRRLREMTAAYPDVVAAVAGSVRGPAIVDGEVVALVDGVPRFRRLLSREGSDVRKAARLAREIPATYYLFDALSVDGRDVRGEPLEARRALLEERVVGAATPVSPWLPGVGREVFRRAVEAGFEGIVAKRRGSAYHEGRSAEWRKVKKVGEIDAVVGGWVEGEGRRAGTVGSLAVGLWSPEGLVYLARVGSGLTDADTAAFRTTLARLARPDSPFVNPVDVPMRFVEPVLVVRVEYHEVTEGFRLRGPAYKGLRADKPPEACTIAGELPARA